MIEAILADLKRGLPISRISARFHNALAEAIVAVARQIGQQRVVLSGGCFQNRYLTERAVQRLREEGFRPYWHQRVPPNDGGIALGQVVAALRESRSVRRPGKGSQLLCEPARMERARLTNPCSPAPSLPYRFRESRADIPVCRFRRLSS